MEHLDLRDPSPKKLGRVERRRISVDANAPVRLAPLRSEGPLPLLVTPTAPAVDLFAWAKANRAVIDTSLAEYGAILFRGFAVGGLTGFRELTEIIGGHLESYTYRSTPRTELGGGVYTSTEYPADKSIPFHNENSYTRSWPLKLFFYCELPATGGGGDTPIADSHRVYERIPSAIRDRFADKRVMYVRNYGEGIDLPWQNVFQTDDRSKVEEFCREHGIEMEWKGGGDQLRTRQVCQAVARHPKTGKMLWFNQAHLFHVSSLDAEVQMALLEAFGEDGLPRHTFYGDGTPIDVADLDVIRAAYAEEEVAFPWQREDVLLIDNMAVAHSRGPFTGDRKIRVGMTDPFDGTGL